MTLRNKFFVVVVALGLLLVSALLTVAQDEEPFALTIMHTNDTHAAHEPNSDGDGGVAIQATVVNQIRESVENSLLLDAGDRFSGTLFHTTYVGQDQVQVMNALGYNAMTLGNHEFDNGDEVLAEFIAGLEFPVVTANIDFSASPSLAGLVEPYVVLEVGGEQIGVIGLDTAETVEIASPGEELVFRDDYAVVANEAAAELTEMGVNKIILLTHVGINVDRTFIPDLENVDIVIGGHSHTLLTDAEEFETATGTVYYVQANANNTHLGRIDVEFSADGMIEDFEYTAIELVRYITPDPELAGIVADLAVAVEELRETPTGATATDLLRGDRTVCRVEECGLGNIIADAMRWETDAQIAIMNGGGIRADIEAGEITLGEVLTVHPFGNQISTFELSGADVIAALENGVSRIEVGEDGVVSRDGLSGRFPQVSGISYTFDPTQEPGSRIVEVLLEDGTPIDPEAIYSVVTNNFVRAGGDGYVVFADNAIDPYDFGRLDYEVTGDYMAFLGEVTPELEGRITMVGAEVAPLE